MIVYYQSQLLQLSLSRGGTLLWQATRVTLSHVLVSSYYFYYLPLLCKLRKQRLCTEEKDTYTFTVQSYNHLVCF